MHEKDLQLVESAFKKYYFDHFDLIRVPERTSEREFGYQKFNFGMSRHLCVKSNEELRLMLISNTPSDVYCSNAHYSFPNLPMAEKDWKEADLIFDVDSKDLNLPCRKNHTCIKCTTCGDVSEFQQLCPSCKSNKLEHKSVACQQCINGAKTEVAKLLNILVDDLGINKENIQVYFSGNEGFHISIPDSQYQKLGSRERTELVDYIMFRGAIPETFGMKKFNPKRSSFPDLDEKGWRGRVSKQIYGSKSNRSKAIAEIISKGYSFFGKKIEDLKNSIGVKIDPNVTIDVHRIFRLPGSLNSKSGLSKLYCKNIDKFNPFSDACFIDDDEIEITAKCPFKFALKNRKFGPYGDEKISIPKYAAVYMICKGIATTS